MLRNVPIRQKSLLVIAVPLVMLAGFMGVLFRIGQSLDEATRWTVHSHEVIRAIEGISNELMHMHSENLQLALLGRSESQFEMGERAKRVAVDLDRLREMVGDNERQVDVTDRLAPRVLGLVKSFEEVRRRLAVGERVEGAALSAECDVELHGVLEIADKLRDEERRLSVSRYETAVNISSQRRVVLVFGGLASISFVILFGWRLLRSMLWRLLLIKENLDRFSGDQDLSPPVPALDEIGQIDTAVHEMARTLRAQRSENEMFIYSVSHDLRSPLVNLQGFSKELARAAVEMREALGSDPAAENRDALARVVTEDVPEALHYIDLAVQRQAKIIDSLLMLSRAGRVEYRLTDVDLRACVNGLVEEATARAGADVEFVVGDLPLVHGDRGALERVFDNLIDNAIKYRDPSRACRIEIGCSDKSDDHATIYVRDNGIGIASSNLERAFLPFARFASGPGEGIGLSLVRRVVERHRGRVWIESSLGTGTTVFARLPLAPPAPTSP